MEIGTVIGKGGLTMLGNNAQIGVAGSGNVSRWGAEEWTNRFQADRRWQKVLKGHARNRLDVVRRFVKQVRRNKAPGVGKKAVQNPLPWKYHAGSCVRIGPPVGVRHT